MSARFSAGLRRLQRQLPDGELRLDAETLAAHAGDKWFARHEPEAVALPRSPRSVATILRFANEQQIEEGITVLAALVREQLGSG